MSIVVGFDPEVGYVAVIMCWILCYVKVNESVVFMLVYSYFYFYSLYFLFLFFASMFQSGLLVEHTYYTIIVQCYVVYFNIYSVMYIF